MIDAFKIGVTVALVNQASSGLALLARDFAKTDAQAKQLEARMKSIRTMTLAGGLLVGAGMIGIKGIESTYEAAKKYEQAFARFRALNLGSGVNADADKFAQSTRVMGTSATDLITTLTDLHTVMGDFGNAKAIAPMIARMEFANKAVFDANSKFDEKQGLNLAKVIELRGGFRSQEEMAKQADYMQHVLTGTGGRVTPSDYLGFLKRGGVAARLQSNDVFYYQMEPLIQELTGSGIGNGLMSAYQNLGQGRTTTRTAKELMDLGLVDPKMVEFSTTGKLARIKPGGVKGGDLVASDPMEFLTSVLLPAFKAHGKTTDKEIINEIGTIFTNRTAASLYTTLFQQMDKIEKGIRIDRGAMGIKELDAVADTTPEGQAIKAEKAWENLKIQLGLRIIPLVVPMIGRLADGLESLALFANRNPGLTTALMGTAAALTALATVGGALLLAKAGWMAAVTFLGILSNVGVPAQLATSILALNTASAAALPAIAGLTAGLVLLSTAAATIFSVYNLIKHPADAITYGNNGASGLTPSDEDEKASAGGGWGKLGVWLGLGKKPTGAGAESMPSPYTFALPRGGQMGDASGADFSAGMAGLREEVRALGDRFDGMSVNLDGRRVGSVVAGSIASSLNGPLGGSSSFDTRQSYAPTTGNP